MSGPDTASVVTEMLTDGSLAYNVIVRTGRDRHALFEAVDKEAAEAFAALINDNRIWAVE